MLESLCGGINRDVEECPGRKRSLHNMQVAITCLRGPDALIETRSPVTLDTCLAPDSTDLSSGLYVLH